VVAAGLEEGRRRPAMSSEVPSAWEPFDAVVRHDAAMELGETHREEQRHCAGMELRMAGGLGTRRQDNAPVTAARGIAARSTARSGDASGEHQAAAQSSVGGARQLEAGSAR
jgi:hypothetical protein